MTDEQHVFDDIPEFDVVGDLQRQLSEARAEVAQLRADWARDCAAGLAEVTALREALETALRDVDMALHLMSQAGTDPMAWMETARQCLAKIVPEPIPPATEKG